MALLADCMGYIMCVLLKGCMEHSSIGGLYLVQLYWWAVWGIALLTGLWGTLCVLYCNH